MRGWIVAALVAASVTALAACGLVAANKETDGIARQVYAEISHNADLSKDVHVSPVFEAADSQAALAQIRAMIGPAAPTSSSGTGWHYSSSSGEAASVQMSYTFKYPGKAIDVIFVLQKAPGQSTWTVVGFEASQEGVPVPPVIVGVPPKTAAELDSSSDPNSGDAGSSASAASSASSAE